MATIYLVRHGQASFKSENYDQLSATGYQQAEVLGRWFKRLDKDVTCLVSGSLLRHLQTRDSFLEGLGRSLTDGQIQIDDGFNEMSFQKLLLTARPELSDQDKVNAWLDQQPDRRKAFFTLYSEALKVWIRNDGRHDFDETWLAFKARCLSALKKVARQLPESGSAVVVTSGGPISVLCLQLYGIEDSRLYTINRFLMNTGVTAIKYRDGQFSILYSNNYSHLEEQGQEFLTLV